MKTYRKQTLSKIAKGNKEMKSLLVFIHTKLMNTDVVLAMPYSMANESNTFFTYSDDYAPYVPIAFDNPM